ncbi:uncharacterized protein LOC129576716 [Sitodiplosis mosellana]|uniref:uncharacterized protein LOC129576716 n=1 Tax=Sitodiplosis mosellana TaxID=263140 RepID=UPI0024443BA8|nr:uncharacterized protein LOC129576716 [Sitodiplosis mosellana]
MANIWISFVILSLFGVILQVKCITQTFGETSDNPPVLKENINIHGEILIVKKAIVEWPSKDSVHPTSNGTIIRGIVHIDNKQPGHGPSLRFINGGYGHPFVILELISKRGHGIQSTILIYV